MPWGGKVDEERGQLARWLGLLSDADGNARRPRPAAVTAEEAIAVLYQELLGRAPDADGLGHHATAFREAGRGLAEIAAELRTSREALSGLARSPLVRDSRRSLWAERALPPLEGRPLFVLHIMKTGGTSLIEGLRTLASPRMFLTETFLDDLVSVPRFVLENVTLIAGHLGYEARGLLPPRFATCVVLRDPVERTLSHYAHLRRDARVRAESPNFSLEEFLTSARWRSLAHNYQARQLVHEIGLAGAWAEYSPEERFRGLGAPFPPEHALPLQSFFDCSPLSVGSDELQALGLKRLRSIEFVGVTEHLDLLFARLAHAWGFGDPGTLPRLHVSETRPRRTKLRPDVIELIEEATAVDRSLYEYARTRTAP